MAYKDMVLGTLTQTAIDERDNVYFKMAQEVEEVYRKAKAFDEILNIEDNYFDKYDEPITSEEFLCEFDFILDNYERNERADDER